MDKLIKACNELGYNTVNFETFKKLHKDDTEGRDLLISNIKEVNVFDNGITVTFNNDKKITALSNGVIYKGKYVVGKKAKYDGGRARVVGLGEYKLNTSIYSEFIWGIAACYLNDVFSESFDGLVVNVMDGTGNQWTAYKLGGIVNCHPSNLEWTTKERNSKHGQIIKKLMNNKCKAYKFSSWDDDILNASNNGDWFNIKMKLIMNEER